MPKRTSTIWNADTDTAPRHAPLAGEIRVHVAVVGGGITGVTTACLLERAGKKVALIEARRIGDGETGRTTAHLTVRDRPALPQHHGQVRQRWRPRGVPVAAGGDRAHRGLRGRAADRLPASSGCPGTSIRRTPSRRRRSRHEAAACQQLGIPAELTDAVPAALPGPAALRFPDQGQFHPLRYLLALAGRPGWPAAAGSSRTAPCWRCTRASPAGSSPPRGRDRRPRRRRGPRAHLQPGLPPHQDRGLPHVRGGGAAGPARPARAVLGHRRPLPLPAEPSPGGRDPSADPGRRGPQGGPGPGPHGAVRPAARPTCAPRFGRRPIEYRWSGQIIEPVDGLPYIGRNSLSSRIYVATGTRARA